MVFEAPAALLTQVLGRLMRGAQTYSLLSSTALDLIIRRLAQQVPSPSHSASLASSADEHQAILALTAMQSGLFSPAVLHDASLAASVVEASVAVFVAAWVLSWQVGAQLAAER